LCAGVAPRRRRLGFAQGAQLKTFARADLELLASSWFQIVLIPVYGGLFALILYVGFLSQISRLVTDGWELLSISSISSGSPFTVFSGVQQTGAGA